MTQTKQIIAERLARFYAEAVAKNPNGTIYENMVTAVEAVPVVSAAHDLRESLIEILANCYFEKKNPDDRRNVNSYRDKATTTLIKAGV